MKTNVLVFALSILGGALLIVSGTHGPVQIFVLILEKLPLFVENALLLTIIGMVALFLIILSSMGGFTVILGGYLVYKNHIKVGKLLIGLGAGVGIPWLLFILFTLMVTQEVTTVIAQHSIAGWTGIILSLIAISITK